MKFKMKFDQFLILHFLEGYGGKISIKKWEEYLETYIYNAGLYRKMAGFWNIKVSFDDDATQDYFDEKDDEDKEQLIFKVTATSFEENHKETEEWTPTFLRFCPFSYRILKQNKK